MPFYQAVVVKKDNSFKAVICAPHIYMLKDKIRRYNKTHNTEYLKLYGFVFRATPTKDKTQDDDNLTEYLKRKLEGMI